MYDLDIVEEDVILQFHNSCDDEAIKTILQPLVNWLNNADVESDDDDDESDDADE
jgi:hypothetical protein